MNIFKIMFLQIRVTCSIFCAPFQLQQSRIGRKVVPLPRKDKKIYYWYMWRLVILFFAIAMPLRVIFRLATRKSQVDVASSLLLMVWTTISLGTHWSQTNIANRREEIALLLNSMILFQKKSGIVLKPGLTNIITLCLVIGATLCPFILPLLSWVVPCSPQYLGNVFMDCSAPEKLHLSNRVWIYFVEIILITAGAMSTSILSNLIVATAGLLNSYIRFVRDINWSGSIGKGNKEQNYIQQQASFYRQIQLLIKLYNASFQVHHLPNILCSCSAVIIGSLFGTIVLYGKIPVAGYLAFPFFVLNCVLILFGTIHLCSCATLSSIALKYKWHNNNYYKSIWLRVFARSCPNLKIRIGPFHDVNRERLAIVYKFCLQRTFFFTVYSKE